MVPHGASGTADCDATPPGGRAFWLLKLVGLTDTVKSQNALGDHVSGAMQYLKCSHSSKHRRRLRLAT